MKVSELAERSGVPLPTIKFYIREGILPAGHRTAKNQADYSEEHLERLMLVRALRDDAGLPVATIASALKAADAKKEEFVGAAIDALQRPSSVDVNEKSPEFARAKSDVMSLVTTMGWAIDEDALAVRDVARSWTIVRRSYPLDGPEFLKPYADVAQEIAVYEIPDGWEPSAAPNAALRYAVLGTVLFEPIILALRRMAHTARARKLEQRARARNTASPTSVAGEAGTPKAKTARRKASR